MKKLTYILLFIWDTGIGQEEKAISISDGHKGENDLKYSGVEWNIDDSVLHPNKFKYDTVKAVLMVCDSADEVNTKFLRTGEEVVSGITSYKDTYFYWLYGYVIIQSEFTMIDCPYGRIGCAVAHYGYGNKKTIGYLDSSKKPFSKEIIIWDYKIIE